MALEGRPTFVNAFLNEKPTVAELCEYVRVGEKWYVLGTLLELADVDLHGIDDQYKDLDLKTTKMFELWLSAKPNPTRRQIIETLKKGTVAKDAVADKYETALKTKLLRMRERTDKILHKYSESLSNLVLPSEIVQTLYTEGVFSKEIFDEVKKVGGSLSGGPLRALSNTVSENFSQLQVFATILLQSEDTVCIANNILKEYDQTQASVLQQSQSDSFTASNISTSSTSSTTNQSIIKHLSPTYEYTFDQMTAKLGDLFCTVIPLIQAAVMPLLEDLKSFLGFCFPKLKPQLAMAKSFDGVMELVREKCTVINISCLEIIINKYNIEGAKAHISAFKSEVDKFCKNVRLTICQDKSFMSNLSSLLKCETIQFTLRWEIDKSTFSDISGLLWKAFEDMTNEVLVKEVKSGNSIIVTCYAPRNVMDVLLLKANMSLGELQKMGLIKLTIGYYTVWNERTMDMKGLAKETRALKNENTLQKKALAENAYKIIGLKTFEANISPILFGIYALFLLFICLSAMRGRIKLIAPLPGVEVLASTRLLVAGGQPNILHWEEYGLKLYIPDDALPPGFLAEIVVRVSLSGPFVYPDSEFWTPASAVYWISSSKDFINPVQLGLWHSAKGLQSGSDLRIVTAQDEAQNGMYTFEDIASKNYNLEGSFVYLYVNHFSIYSSLSNQLKYDGCLLYRKSPNSPVTWEYSLIVHKHHTDGIVQRLLDQASYTGWTIDIPEFIIEFEQDSNILTLNTSYSNSNLNGWKIVERNAPLMYNKSQIDSDESIRSNMQFLLIWTGKGPRTTQIIRLSLHGAEQPNVISFVTNSEDSEGNKVCGASGGFISSSENLLLYTNHVYQVLLFCHHLGINDAECKMIEHERPNDLEQQKVAVLRVWLEEGERTWRDFIRALALMRQCVVAKKLTKEHHVYFFNADIALEVCNDLNED